MFTVPAPILNRLTILKMPPTNHFYEKNIHHPVIAFISSKKNIH